MSKRITLSIEDIALSDYLLDRLIADAQATNNRKISLAVEQRANELKWKIAE